MSKSIDDKIKRIMSIIFVIDMSSITDNTSPVTLQTWDSLRHMNLIVALEEEFGITLNDDEISSMLDFKSISEFVQKSLR